jgi:hypothetical protein
LTDGRAFTTAQLAWFMRHGYGDPRRRHACHGYANGCVCGCKAAAGGPATAGRPPRQPWQAKVA